MTISEHKTYSLKKRQFLERTNTDDNKRYHETNISYNEFRNTECFEREPGVTHRGIVNILLKPLADSQVSLKQLK